jgi:hypothetical protein
MEVKMVTSKKPTTKATTKVIRWIPDWVVDPGPKFRKVLDKTAIKEIEQAKREFATRVKDILKKGQQK